MRHLFRFSNLVLASALLTVAAVAWLLWPQAHGQPTPLAVPAGDGEIVFLYNATSTSSWERVVTAVQKAHAADPELLVDVDEKQVFPRRTTVPPQFAVSRQGKSGRLLFRWYKLTADWKTEDWVKELLQRDPPPLAIVGGDFSEQAIEFAHRLADVTARPLARTGQPLPTSAWPLLMLVSATADRESHGPNIDSGGDRWLTEIYPGHTFRFCFSNEQMAESVVRFIWAQDDLRPDTDPVYLVYWADDPYSIDLSGPGPEAGFRKALRGPVTRSGAQNVARDWGWLTGTRATGGFPLLLEGLTASQFRLEALSLPHFNDSSVGSFDRPNHFEMETAGHLCAEQARQPDQQRPLLLLGAQDKPTRRFLRGITRTSPEQARRFVVGTGDAIGFNTIYRDRNVAWPVRDLPFDLVLFAHRTPVDSDAGFRPRTPGPSSRLDGSAPTTSTDTLLLFQDIVTALGQAGWEGDRLVADAGQLRDNLHRIERGDQLLFDPCGNRNRGTGESVVWLHPLADAGWVLPRARLTVWQVTPHDEWRLEWEQTITYEGAKDEGSDSHAGN